MAHILCQYLLQKREDGRAQYFSSNTARRRESKGTKQPSLPAANIQAALSGACILQAGKTIRQSVSEALFIDVFIISHDPYMLVSSFTVDYTCICKKGLGCAGSGAALSVFFPTFSLFLHHLFVCLHPSPS